MKINEDHVSDIRALVSTGDVVLSERRAAFKKMEGRDTLLDDEKLIRAIAATDDDDDELFVSNVKAVEAGE